MTPEEFNKIQDSFMAEYDLWNQDGFVGCGHGVSGEGKGCMNVYWNDSHPRPNFPETYRGIKVRVVHSGPATLH